MTTIRTDYACTSGVITFSRPSSYRENGPEQITHPVPTPPEGPSWKPVCMALGPREGDTQRLTWMWERPNPEDTARELERYAAYRRQQEYDYMTGND